MLPAGIRKIIAPLTVLGKITAYYITEGEGLLELVIGLALAAETPDLKQYEADQIFRPVGNTYELVHPYYVLIPETAFKAPIKKAEPLIYVWTDKDGNQNAGTFDEIPEECRP